MGFDCAFGTPRKRKIRSYHESTANTPLHQPCRPVQRSEPVESDNHADDGRLSEGKACASNPESQKREIDEEFSGGFDIRKGRTRTENMMRIIARLPLMLQVILNRNPNPHMARPCEQFPEVEKARESLRNPAGELRQSGRRHLPS